MKRLWSILLCVVMLMGMGIHASAAAQDEPMAVKAKRSSNGKELTVSVVLTESLTDGTFELTYDADCLSLVSVSAPDPDTAEINGPSDAEGVSAGADLAAGSVRTAFVFDESGCAGDVLLQCVFQVVGSDRKTTLCVEQAQLNNGSAAVACPAFSVTVQLKSSQGGGASGGTSSEETKTFSDVSGTDWFYNEVAFVVEAGLMNGTGDGSTFSPGANVTRGMMMTILARMDGVDTSASSPWYQVGMEWAKAEGVSDGTNPGGDITREQIVTMLWRYAGEPAVSGGHLSTYPAGGDTSSWAVDAVNWAVSIGLMSGDGNGRLNPTATASRAELAVLLARFCQKVG